MMNNQAGVLLCSVKKHKTKPSRSGLGLGVFNQKSELKKLITKNSLIVTQTTDNIKGLL